MLYYIHLLVKIRNEWLIRFKDMMFWLQVCNHPELFERRDVKSPFRMKLPEYYVPKLMYHEGYRFCFADSSIVYFVATVHLLGHCMHKIAPGALRFVFVYLVYIIVSICNTVQS